MKNGECSAPSLRQEFCAAVDILFVADKAEEAMKESVRWYCIKKSQIIYYAYRPVH